MSYENKDYEHTNKIPLQNREQPFEKPKNNSGLIIAVSVLSSILVIGIVLVVLFISGVISFGSEKPDTTLFNEQAKYSTQETSPTAAPFYQVLKVKKFYRLTVTV